MMNTALPLLVALAVGAFEAPKQIPVTDELKSDLTTLTAVDAGTGKLVGSTQAGPVTYSVSPKTIILSAQGTAVSIASLKVGERVRVYYVTGKGAEALEIDLQQAH
jgi:hypothetical protein